VLLISSEGTSSVATQTTTPLDVRFPPAEGGRTTQDREWCEVTVDGETQRVRFHDYDEIFSIPGLYEAIFHDHLECCSPEQVVGLLAEQVREAGEEPRSLSGIDVGAGNGLVGEELRAVGLRALVGADIIPEAATAAERDRPEVYDDYVVCDLTDLSADERERLCAHAPDCMTCVAALVQDGGWIAFNIKADFLDTDDESGFRRLIVRMLDEGVLEERGRRRYCHRLDMHGRPIDYVALVGRKRGDVPAAWLA
jgi:hypothetical protein